MSFAVTSGFVQDNNQLPHCTKSCGTLKVEVLFNSYRRNCSPSKGKPRQAALYKGPT